jgi:pimeloyl-ACP methyl ester carboxylesterase
MLHYTTYRKEGTAPWVTFIHGAGGSSSVWYRQVKAFSAHFNVLLVDLRGHGDSAKASANGRYTFGDIARDVVEVLDDLRIGSAHFVGISLGTIVVREMAEHWPDRVRSMVMAGAVMKLNIRGKLLMRLSVWFRTFVPYMILYRTLAFVIMPRSNHREARNLFVREARKLAQKEFNRWFRLTADLNDRLRLFRQRDLGIPTLYIMGEQDHMFLPSIRRLVDSHTASSSLVVVPDCGHVVNVERPLVFNHTAIDFLKEVAR